MKCQHCGSDDIITIQGEHFCLNCGTIVKAPAAPPVVAESPKSIPVNKVLSRTKSKEVASSDANAYPALAGAQSPKTSAIPSELREPTEKPSDLSVHPIRFALRISSVLALAMGLIVGAMVGFQVDNDIILYVGGVGGLAILIVLTLAQSALVYGFSRNYDKRPASHDVWWSAARSGFLDIINANLISLIIFLEVIGADIVLWRLVATGVQLAPGFEIAILAVLNAVTAWLLLGAYVAKRLAVPAITVGGMTAAQSLKVGWKFYLKAGGHLVAASLEILLVRIALLLVVGILIYGAIAFDVQLGNMVAVAAGVLTAIICFIATMSLLEIEMRLWMRQYRQWASMQPAALRVRLTTGRLQPQKDV